MFKTLKKKAIKFNYKIKRMFNKKEIKKKIKKNQQDIDISLPGRSVTLGNLHPISININNIKKFFCNLGFDFLCGPEIENSYNNFDALNIPFNHPSRSKKDTFWITENLVLRTHTTCVPIKMIKDKTPPFKFICIGKVYRSDNDNTHTPMFHQLEGLIVDKRVSICNLKDIISHFLLYYFNNDIKIRFRPSYFPFTEPSIEVDILFEKKKIWLEILGCGLLHQNVLKNVGINSYKYNALAFGIGIERLMMVKYNINDLRILFANNLRFLKKFKYLK